ncbi:unnamed protein product [Staurois parvus]|uniref:Uncharacterized protein n=1 Tax=Staurois parvus TaxID=386267 RepID=A0ABN9DDM3_9NEOB|nr:unnamed protein product [Staurois parvus]
MDFLHTIDVDQTPLCHFTWPITSWLSCCSQLLPLCYNTTNS